MYKIMVSVVNFHLNIFSTEAQRTQSFTEKLIIIALKKLKFENLCLSLHPGKSYTASSLGIPQGLTAARVLGCSGAI